MRSSRSRLALLVCVLLGSSGEHRNPAYADATPGQRGRHDATAHHSFEDVDHWVRVFDDPARDRWQQPAEVVRALDLRPGMTVADLGAGTGYFLRYLSEAVGETGTVLAVEPELNLLGYLRARAEREHANNVVPILASFDNPRIPRASTDLVLLVDTVHHINDRLVYLRRLQKLLKPAGRVAIIDWHKRELPEGPPLEHKLAREQVIEEMTAAGYSLSTEPDFLPYQYFLIFRPLADSPRPRPQSKP
jgi:ubiquinone/menaquinone biosynthesis C-methylase UbiE